MKAYWVVRGNILNQDEYSKYIDLAGPIVSKHNGKFLVRGGQQIEVEGEGFDRTVLIEFNTFDEALFCYNSDEYQLLAKHRFSASESNIVIVNGID